jgi:hypothetical protein
MRHVPQVLILIAASVLTVVFRRPLARWTVRMQNVTSGFRFGERIVRMTEIMIWVVAAGWLLLAVWIAFAPSPRRVQGGSNGRPRLTSGIMPAHQVMERT